jgi:hypothetical protein
VATDERKQEIRAKCEELATEKARRIGFAGWVECAKDVLTAQEQDEIRGLWETMPGHTSWADALRRWMGDAGRYIQRK